MNPTEGSDATSPLDLGESAGSIARRSILAAGASALAGSLAIYASDTASSPPVPKNVGDPHAITSWGAIPDGVSDSTQAINLALSRGGRITFPREGEGIYLISGSLLVQRDGTQIDLEAGVILRTTSSVPMILNSGFSDFSIYGNGSTLDLNETSDCGIRVVGTGPDHDEQLAAVSIRDIQVRNKSFQNTVSSAIEIRNAKRVSLSHIYVAKYGDGIPNPRVLQTYGVGIFFCSSVKIEQLSIEDACVGLEIQACADFQMNQFSIDRTSDNGIYILAGSEGISISQGLVRSAEEGIVVLSPQVQIDGVRFISCTNKAISLRHTSQSTVSNCYFFDNKLAIGDDGEGRPLTRCSIRGNRFAENGLRDIDLENLQTSPIDDNDFLTNGKHEYFIRLNRSDRVDLTRNVFEDVDARTTVCIMVAGETKDCSVTSNRFISGLTAIRLAPGGSSDSGLAPVDTTLAYNLISQDFANDISEGSGVSGTLRVPLGK